MTSSGPGDGYAETRALGSKMTGKTVARAIKQYKIDVEKVNPVGI